MKHLLFLLFAGLSLTSALSDAPVVQREIAFLGAGRRERADIYYPPGRHSWPLPAVLLIHGGGGFCGDKGNSREVSMANDLANAGYAVFSINYVLCHWENDLHCFICPWPQNFYDCKSALRFMRKQAAQLNIDPNRIAVMGESAGGHLALLVGVTAKASALNQGGLYTSQSDAVSCIVDLYGISDLTAFDQWKIANLFRGATDAETTKNIRLASPVTWFNAKTPPVLIIHGANDHLVPVEMSRQLAARLKKLGVVCKYEEVPGAGHGFDFHPRNADLRPVVLGFLKKYLGAPGTPK